MNQFVMDTFLYTSDFGEDAYLFNSSSSSDSEDDIECTCSEVQPVMKPKIQGYVEIEVPKLNEYDFKHHFRVTRDTFEKILGTKTLSFKMYEQIRWPSMEEYHSISKMFQEISHLKRCLGVLGVSYIKIPKPKEVDSYKGIKKMHSIDLQGTVTINGKFIDLYVTEGPNEPEFILEMSSLHKEAEKDLFGEYYLIGFSDYINRPWLVQAFEDDGSLSPAQQFFNTCHETAANIFPKALGILKGRFQRLQHFENRDVPFVVQCVEAACTIHNMAIDYEDDCSDFFFSDIGILDNKEIVYSRNDDGGTRMKVFEELLTTEDEGNG